MKSLLTKGKELLQKSAKKWKDARIILATCLALWGTLTSCWDMIKENDWGKWTKIEQDISISKKDSINSMIYHFIEENNLTKQIYENWIFPLKRWKDFTILIIRWSQENRISKIYDNWNIEYSLNLYWWMLHNKKTIHQDGEEKQIEYSAQERIELFDKVLKDISELKKYIPDNNEE